jgi:hypothetical protein
VAVDSSALREDLRRRAEDAFQAATEEMVVFARAETPVDTGDTREAAHIEPGASSAPLLSATLVVDTPQARYTDEGTGPHVIEGNPLLVFEWGGRTVFFRSVNHPGSTKHVGWFSERVVGKWGDAIAGGWHRSG